MAILKVARLGHPTLRSVTAAVTGWEPSAETRQLIGDMIATMREYDGAGLSANQVHEDHRISVLEVRFNRLYPDTPQVPLTVLVNPVVTPIGEEIDEGWEGCLSVPDMRGLVPRHRTIQLDALDAEGAAIKLVATGFHARVIQHEADHLDGLLYLDRMQDLTSLCYTAEWQKHWLASRGSDEE